MPAKDCVLGVDFGTNSVRVGIFDLAGNEIVFRDAAYDLITPKTGYAEQNVADWWAALCTASNAAIAESEVNPNRIVGIGTDTTACTPVFLDKRMQPLMNAILWMDVRSAQEARQIGQSGHPMLKYNGFGNVSPEWMPCKSLWVKRHLPEIYAKSAYILECEDWLNYRLTGRVTASLNTATTRWYYDNRNGGRQDGFFEAIGLSDVLDKIPSDVLAMGEPIGTLTAEAARDLGLSAGIPVGQGGADAYVAMFGLGAVREHRAALVTGSSHLLLVLSEREIHAQGLFGSFPDAIVPGLELVEAGQSSTGSIVNWHVNQLCGNVAGEDRYAVLNRAAGALPIGAEGLICLDYFQGNRTPYTDGDVRGLISGLSLVHTPAHIYRALIESICYGTEVIFRNCRANGISLSEVNICGGAVKSPFWLQTHADVSNLPINIPKTSEAPTLGAAIIGAVAGKAHPSLAEASDAMVTIVDRIEPDAARHEAYRFYVDRYAELYAMMSAWMHKICAHERGAT